MSFLEPYILNKERLEKRRSEITTNLRTDWVLKLISLLTAITLYIYVQTERNPTIQRSFNGAIAPVNVAEGLDYDFDASNVTVTISGPKSVLEGLKESDIRMVADMRRLNPEIYTSQTLLLQPQIPNLPAQTARELVFDPPTPSVHTLIYQPKTISLPVAANYLQRPRVGYRYGTPEIKPGRVRLTGRAERINRIVRLVVNALPVSPGEKVDGEFTVQAKDSDDRLVEGVQMEPNAVSVVVPLQEEPPSKIVLVSADVSERPAFPYEITDIKVEPSQLKLLGRQERLANLSTITTDPISAKAFIQNQTVTARLNTPPDIGLRDDDDKPVASVKVTFTIKKMASSEDPRNAKPPNDDTSQQKGVPPSRPTGSP